MMYPFMTLDDETEITHSEYLESKEFEDEIENLKNEKKFNKKKGIYEVESSNYIKDYIIKAYNLINYFSESD